MDFKERIGHMKGCKDGCGIPLPHFVLTTSNMSATPTHLTMTRDLTSSNALIITICSWTSLHACYCLQINLYVCTETYPQPFITLLLNTLTIPTRRSTSVSLATPAISILLPEHARQTTSNAFLRIESYQLHPLIVATSVLLVHDHPDAETVQRA